MAAPIVLKYCCIFGGIVVPPREKPLLILPAHRQLQQIQIRGTITGGIWDRIHRLKVSCAPHGQWGLIQMIQGIGIGSQRSFSLLVKAAITVLSLSSLMRRSGLGAIGIMLGLILMTAQVENS